MGSSNTKNRDSENPCDIYKKLSDACFERKDSQCGSEWSSEYIKCLSEESAELTDKIVNRNPPVRVKIVK